MDVLRDNKKILDKVILNFSELKRMMFKYRSEKIRKKIDREKTGKCPICTINLYGKDMTPGSGTFPCNIENCPFEVENEKAN